MKNKKHMHKENVTVGYINNQLVTVDNRNIGDLKDKLALVPVSKLKINKRKEEILKRINKLEQFILEENTPNIAKKAFETNLRHLREEYRELEILERSVEGEET